MPASVDQQSTESFSECDGVKTVSDVKKLHFSKTVLNDNVKKSCDTGIAVCIVGHFIVSSRISNDDSAVGAKLSLTVTLIIQTRLLLLQRGIVTT